MFIQTNPTIKAQLLAWARKKNLWFDEANPDLGFIWREAVIHYGLAGSHLLSHPDVELLGNHKQDFLSASEIEIGGTPLPSEPVDPKHVEEVEEPVVVPEDEHHDPEDEHHDPEDEHHEDHSYEDK